MATQVIIIAGPSKFDLMTALFDRKPYPRKVFFKTEEGEGWYATIVSVQSEEGSSEGWNLGGHFFKDKDPKYSLGTYTMLFNTRDRKGVAQID